MKASAAHGMLHTRFVASAKTEVTGRETSDIQLNLSGVSVGRCDGRFELKDMSRRPVPPHVA